MKTFNIDEIVKYSKTVLQFSGVWPEKVPTIRYTLRAILSSFTTSTTAIFLLLQALDDLASGEIANAVFELCLVIACCHATFKVCFLHYNKKEFFQIFEDLRNPVLTTHEDHFDTYVQFNVLLSSRIAKFLLVACVSTAFAINIGEYIDDYRTGPHSLAINTNYNSIVTYTLAWYLYSFGCIFTACIIGAYEGLIFILISVADAHLKILCKKITAAIDYQSPNHHDGALDVDRKVNILLRKCVIRHNAIETFMISIENGLSLGFLIQLLVSLSLTGLVGFNFVFVSIKSPNFVKCVLFFIADFTQLTLICIACNEVILQGEKIRDACYMSDWNKRGASVCKTLYIIMERSKRPLNFTAGKFAVISLETFVVILKMSMSYFALLKKVYIDPK